VSWEDGTVLEKVAWSRRVGGFLTDARIYLAKAEGAVEAGDFQKALDCLKRVRYDVNQLLKAVKEAAGEKDEKRG
jgi:hypothetical protein